MTDPTGSDATLTTASAGQLDRIAKIRQRRAETSSEASSGASAARAHAQPLAFDGHTPPSGKRRRHAAQGSRILAAGMGATSMFGIVTALGWDSATSGAEAPGVTAPVVQPTAPAPASPPVRVVIHRIPAATVPSVTSESATPAEEPEPIPDAATVVSEPAVAAPEAPAPVQLTANPVVRTVTIAAPSQPSPKASSAPAASAPAPAATTSGSR